MSNDKISQNSGDTTHIEKRTQSGLDRSGLQVPHHSDDGVSKGSGRIGTTDSSLGKEEPVLSQSERVYEINPDGETREDLIKSLHDLGINCAIQGKTDDAILYLERAHSLNQDFAHIRENLFTLHGQAGISLYNQGRYTESLPHIERAFALGAGRPGIRDILFTVYSRVGVDSYNDGNLIAAEYCLRQAQAIKPNDDMTQENLSNTLQNIGLNHSLNGDINKAIDYLEQALAIRPNDEAIRSNLFTLHAQKGIALCGRGSHEEAILNIERAHEIRPDNNNIIDTLFSVHSQCGIVHYNNGDYAEGLRHFERANGLKPDDKTARSNLCKALSSLGLVHATQGRLAEALPHLERAAVVDPNHATINDSLFTVHGQLGIICYNEEKYEESIPHLQRALSIKTESPSISDSLFSAYSQAGIHRHNNNDLLGAISYFRLAYNMCPEDESSIVNLIVVLNQVGAIEFNKGSFEEALVLFDDAHRINPNNPTVNNNLAKTLSRIGRDLGESEAYANALSCFLRADSVMRGQSDWRGSLLIVLNRMCNKGLLDVALGNRGQGKTAAPANGDMKVALDLLDEVFSSFEEGDMRRVADITDGILCDALRDISENTELDLLSHIVLSFAMFLADQTSSLNITDCLVNRIPPDDSPQMTAMTAWAKYIRSMIILKTVSYLDEQIELMHRNYCVSPIVSSSVPNAPSLLEIRNQLVDRSQQDLDFAKILKRSFVDRAALVLEIFKGNCIARECFSGFKDRSLSYLHTLCAYALRYNTDIEIVEQIVKEAESRMSPDILVRLHRNVSLLDPHNDVDCCVTVVFERGSMDVNGSKIVRGSVENYTARTVYEAVTKYQLSDFSVISRGGIVRLRNGDIVKETIPYLKNDVRMLRALVEGNWVAAISHSMSAAIVTDNYTITVERNRAEQEDVHQNAVLLTDATPVFVNYFHWVTDGLPRMLAAHLDKNAHRETITILREKNLLQLKEPLILGSMNAAGISSENVTISPISSYPVRVINGAFLRGFATGRFSDADIISLNPSAILALRENLLKDVTDAPQAEKRYIYIPRRVRGVTNQDDVADFLRMRGFSEICSDGMSFLEQRNVFCGADVLVAPVGAGLANMIFMKRGSKVITFSPETNNVNCFYQLATILGISFTTIQCENEYDDKDKLHCSADTFLDIRDLSLAVGLALEGTG